MPSWLGLASISCWSQSDHQEDATIMCLRSPDTMNAVISKGNRSFQCCTPGWLCVHAIRLLSLSVTWYACIAMQQSQQAASVLHPRYSCAQEQDHTLHVCTTDQFMVPVLKYSSLFSTAMEGTALGGASYCAPYKFTYYYYYYYYLGLSTIKDFFDD